MLPEEKSSLRSHFLNLRNALSTQQRALEEQVIDGLVRNHERVRNADNLCCYAAFRAEVSTNKILQEQLLAKGTVILPKVNVKAKTLTFHHIASLEMLTTGAYGILEPIDGPEVAVDSIDCMLLPGVAFTASGQRLGYGGGYYDRALRNHHNVYTIGLAFSVQVATTLPVEKHDVGLDEVLIGY